MQEEHSFISPLPIRRSDSSEAYHAIKQLISEGYLKPGERVNTSNLAEQLGVSRTPIREALAMVEAEGLVQSIPKKGMIVYSFSKKEIQDIYTLRELLEGHAVRQAAVAENKKFLSEMQTAWRKIDEKLATIEKWESTNERAKHVQNLTKCSREFHNTILKASGNSRLELVMKLITEVPLTSTVYFHYSSDQLRHSNQQHKEIIDAIEAREPQEAALIMGDHIRLALDVLLEHIS